MGKGIGYLIVIFLEILRLFRCFISEDTTGNLGQTIDDLGNLTGSTVRFALKPGKVFAFREDTGERIRF